MGSGTHSSHTFGDFARLDANEATLGKQRCLEVEVYTSWTPDDVTKVIRHATLEVDNVFWAELVDAETHNLVVYLIASTPKDAIWPSIVAFMEACDRQVRTTTADILRAAAVHSYVHPYSGVRD